MSLYSVQISGRQYRVEIRGEKVRLNGQQVKTGLLPLDHPGLFCFTHGSRQRDMYLYHQHNGTYAINTEGRQLVAEVQIDNENNNEQAVIKSADKDKLYAPMPGVVLKVHATDGEIVSVGQLLVTLESMKMQMEFRSPFEGKVTQVAVQPDQKVEKDTLLVSLERAV